MVGAIDEMSNTPSARSATTATLAGIVEVAGIHTRPTSVPARPSLGKVEAGLREKDEVMHVSCCFAHRLLSQHRVDACGYLAYLASCNTPSSR
jgi:hypothetical protein